MFCVSGQIRCSLMHSIEQRAREKWTRPQMDWRRIVAAAASMQCELLSLARQYYIVCIYNGASSCVGNNYVATCIRRRLASVGVSSSVCLCAMRPRFRTWHACCSVRGSLCLHMQKYVHRCRFMLVCVASQMPLRARLFSRLLASHSWRASACTAAPHAHIRTSLNQRTIVTQGHTQASDRMRVICASSPAPEQIA